MVNRRSFLMGSGSLALAHLLSSCAEGDRSPRVSLLQGSVPSQLVKQFQQAIPGGKKLIFQPESQLQKIYELLQLWQKPGNYGSNFGLFPRRAQPGANSSALVTLGDAWLASAIQAGLIQPIAPDRLTHWGKLPPRWQELVQRNDRGYPDGGGRFWGSPYRWGGTLIVYRQDKFRPFSWTPTDWSDLWKEELRGRISLIDQPREVIGFTLKSLGYSYNSPHLSTIAALKSRLHSLQPQIKFYSSKYYLQPLLLGDTWLAVGWSGDILPVVASSPNLKVVVPRSGTSLWADVWVKPKTANPSPPLLEAWMDYCWRSESAYLISRFSDGLSPLLLTEPLGQIPPDLSEEPLLTAERSIIDRSEFILPLSPSSQAEYEKLWREVRTMSGVK